MTPKQIADVQRTFALVVPIKEKAAELFYGRLFSIDPSVKPLFKGDMVEQGRKLMAALATVVSGLTDLPRILPVAQNMGRRHAGYGVEERHYDSVGAALLWTLEQGLGKEFTPDVRQAWTAAYTTLATVMKDAARGSRAVA
jgi:nitric oxide dioxygenase